jgi:hypothetical protein
MFPGAKKARMMQQSSPKFTMVTNKKDDTATDKQKNKRTGMQKFQNAKLSKIQF